MKQKMIICNRVKYNKIDYCVFKSTCGSDFLFITDNMQFNNVNNLFWLKCDSECIMHYIYINGMKKKIYLHDIVMNNINNINNTNRNTCYYHINGQHNDCRQINLKRIDNPCSKLECARKKHIELYTNIDFENIPKYVWFKKNRLDGKESFIFEFNKNNINIKWSSVDNDDLSQYFKLEHVKKYLRKLKSQPKYKILFEKYDIGCKYNEQYYELLKSYNKIIELSNFDCANDFIAEIPINCDLLNEDLSNLSNDEIELLYNIDV